MTKIPLRPDPPLKMKFRPFQVFYAFFFLDAFKAGVGSWKQLGKKYFSWGAFTPRLPKSMPDDNNQSPYIAEKTRAAALRESASE